MTERYEPDDEYDEYDDDAIDEDDEDDEDEFEDDVDHEHAAGPDTEGGEAEPWDLLSQALGSLDELDSDEELALDVSEQGGGANQPERFAKVSLDQATNLLAVRSLAAGVKDATITVEVYRSKLKLMVRSLEEALKVIKSETVVNHLEELPPEQKVYFLQTSQLVEALVQGGHSMLRYPESKSVADIDQGLGIIEQAFLELDEIQDKAIDLGREIVLREAASE